MSGEPTEREWLEGLRPEDREEAEGVTPARPTTEDLIAQAREAAGRMEYEDDEGLLLDLAAALEAVTAERDRLQKAVDRAHGALDSSAHVGGPSEREAWRTAVEALGALVTQHQAQGERP